jgi:hypothetical protein
VVPTAWPVNRFEQAFTLYMLLLVGLLDHPALVDVIQPQIDDLARAFRPEGVGFSDYFTPDGDDTAAALAVLHAAGRPVNLAVLERFAHNSHYTSWQGELQPSLSVTTHALHALKLSGANVTERLSYITEQQEGDGRWRSDKWNGSWLYTTWQALALLLETGYHQKVWLAIKALLDHQHADGGWGTQNATAEETAYAVLALRGLHRSGRWTEATSNALQRAERWLQCNYRPFGPDTTTLWLAKQPYRVFRLSRVIELTATLPQQKARAMS